MQPATGKIGLLLLTVILMPLLLFSVFEIGSLKRNEKVVQEIYTNQLDAILFSINQYSDDVISSLARRIETHITGTGDSVSEVQDVLAGFPSVTAISLYERESEKLSFTYPPNYYTGGITEALGNYDSILIRLQGYLQGGYRKIESLQVSDDTLCNIVFASATDNHHIFTVITIDPKVFITQLLDPKIQEIARGSFDIVAFEENNPVPFYSSDKQESVEREYESRPFWLLKGYYMGIELNEMTVSSLARSRSARNMILVGLADLILIAGIWILYRNITKQMELSRLKSDFVSNVSHEIRTPLSLIRMNVETLEMGRISDPEKIKDYYSVILDETTRLSNIVNRILNFSRIEADKQGYLLLPSDLNEITGRAINHMKHVLDTSGFSHAFIPAKELPQVAADSNALSDALINLLDNAMKYSEDDKQIIVRTGCYENYVYVEVEDHGIGIPAKYTGYIFDKFFRVSEPFMAARTKGSGLGLSIVKHITEAHGGKINVESVPGKGSLFRLLLPVAKTGLTVT